MLAVIRAVCIATVIFVGGTMLSGGCQSKISGDGLKGRPPSADGSPLPQSTLTATVQSLSPASVPPTPVSPANTPDAGNRPVDEQEAAANVIPMFKGILPRGPRKPPPTRLIISSIGVDAKVIALGTHYNETGDLVWDTAPFAVGHHQGTVNPGELGNMVLSGHISSSKEGSVFKRLPEIAVGDGVVVVTADRNYVYQVIQKKVVEPTQIEVMNSAGDKILTMLTCVPDGVYTHRLVVIARQI